MKCCTKCKAVKPLVEFSKDKNRTDGLYCQCKACCREHARKHYRQNPAPYKERVKLIRPALRKYLREQADEIKKLGCVVCGEKTLCCLDFHHVFKKTRAVALAVSSFATFEKEVNKCAVLCANCHRKTHAGLITIEKSMLCNIKVNKVQFEVPFNTFDKGIVHMNSIFAIKPYKWENIWVFDDEKVGLVKEALVAGTDDMLDVATAHIPNADKGFIALFSATPFPTAQIVVDWVREETGGNVYRWKEKNMEGWLCPALLLYFSSPPPYIYVEVRPLEQTTTQ